MRKAIHRYTLITLFAVLNTLCRRHVRAARNVRSECTNLPRTSRRAAGVSFISKPWLLIVRGGSNATPGLWVIKVEVFARNEVKLQACA